MHDIIIMTIILTTLLKHMNDILDMGDDGDGADHSGTVGGSEDAGIQAGV